MSLETIRSVIDALADMKSLYLTLSGGEILVREDFFPIARHARMRGFALRLLTNGTLITDEIAHEIQQLSPLSVEMSLYAAEAGLHDRITGRQGSFEKTLQAFHMLRKRGVRTRVKSLLMKDNAGQHGDLERLSRELGADFLYDVIVIPRDDGNRDPLRFRLDSREMTDLFSRDERAVSFEPLSPVNDDTFMCSAGLNSLLISPYGDVFPCVGLKESAGNIDVQAIQNILISPVFQRVRSTTFSELAICRNCDMSPYCRRCPGLAASEDGDYLGPSRAACESARALSAAAERKFN